MKVVTEGINNITRERICYALDEDEITLSNYTQDELDEILAETDDEPEDLVLVTFFDSIARNKMMSYGVYYMDRGKEFKSLAAASAFLKGLGFIL